MARTKPEPFARRKEKGDAAEREFMEQIALMGGHAHAIGHVPGNEGAAPRYCYHQPADEDGYDYFVSPDIAFHLPHQPFRETSVAQVKIKKAQSRPHTGELFIYLDEKELHRMRRASRHYDVFFVIHIEEFAGQPALSPWLWVHIDDLREVCITLRKRTVAGKKTFVVPLDLFRPLEELAEPAVVSSANYWMKPRTLTDRLRDYERRLIVDAETRHPTITAQAHSLGIPRSTLHSKKSALGLL